MVMVEDSQPDVTVGMMVVSAAAAASMARCRTVGSCHKEQCLRSSPRNHKGHRSSRCGICMNRDTGHRIASHTRRPGRCCTERLPASDGVPIRLGLSEAKGSLGKSLGSLESDSRTVSTTTAVMTVVVAAATVVMTAEVAAPREVRVAMEDTKEGKGGSEDQAADEAGSVT